jgi:hypothetical protein
MRLNDAYGIQQMCTINKSDQFTKSQKRKNHSSQILVFEYCNASWVVQCV